VTTSDLALALDVAPQITTVPVATASEMREALVARSGEADVIVMSAAVADFTVVARDQKIKKDQGLPSLELVETVDIVAELVAKRHAGQVIVGFAAETNNVLENATAKLHRKGVDLLVVNDVSAPGAGFEHDTNEVLLLGRDASVTTVSLRSKEAISLEIFTRVSALIS